jgi:hypothetical protein
MKRLILIFPVHVRTGRQLHDARCSIISVIVSGIHSVTCIRLHYALYFWS